MLKPLEFFRQFHIEFPAVNLKQSLGAGMNTNIKVDIVIFGGGIAGLWILNRLSQMGLSVLLFETGTLGGGQTFHAQGIIHGGMKYALQGALTGESQALASVPDLWRSCLDGQGEISLSQTKILSNKHYLFSPSKFKAKIAGFLASHTLQSQVEKVPPENYPKAFQHPEFKGELFSVDEIVLDVPSLIKNLAKPHFHSIIKINPFAAEDFNLDAQHNITNLYLKTDTQSIQVQAQHFIFAAGAGNGIIAKQLNLPAVEMQKRPLRMVLVKLPFDAPVYAHCVGLSDKPRLTITTHYTQQGEMIWYLGGQLAEEGVQRSEAEQIAQAQKELSELFPWLNFQEAQFSSFCIDRAEPLQANQTKPKDAYSKTLGNISICWPTKLALAPLLAQEIVKEIQAKKIKPHFPHSENIELLSKPAWACPIWETAFC